MVSGSRDMLRLQPGKSELLHSLKQLVCFSEGEAWGGSEQPEALHKDKEW